MSNLTITTASSDLPNQHILFLANACEMAINLVAMPLATLNFVLIFRASVIHPNLKFILLFQSCFILMRGTTRFLICLFKFLSLDIKTLVSPVYFFYSLGIYCRNFVVHILIIERLMATVMVKTYELRRNWYFSALWSPILFLLGLYNTVAPVANDQRQEINLITTTALFILGIGEFGIFYWLWRFNAKLYQQRALNMHSLSERYQLSENIRIGKHLTPALLLHIFNIFTGGLSLYWNYLDLPGLSYYYAFNVNSNSFCGVVIEYTIITCHPFLKRDFALLRRRFFSLFCLRNGQTSSVSPENCAAPREHYASGGGRPLALRDIINGQNLIGNEGADDHFAMLRRAWAKE